MRHSGFGAEKDPPKDRGGPSGVGAAAVVRRLAFIHVLCVASFLPRTLSSQEWLLGAVGGGISNDLVGDDIPDPRWGRRLTVAAGAVVEFWPVANLGARLEALYVLRGTHFRDEDELFEQRSAYLELPLLVTLGVGIGSRLTLRTFAGPSLSFLVRCRIVNGFRPLRTVNDSGPLFLEASQDCNDGPLDYPTRTTDVGFLVGGGAAVEVGRVPPIA